MKGERGFTLLELLMVVIIISILASTALPQYLKTAERARAAEALAVLAAIRSSELRFRAQSGLGNLYTTDLNLLDIGVPGFSGVPLPPVPLWTYTVPTTGAETNAIATRVGAPGTTVEIDLDNGATCTSHQNAYGLNPLPC